jgi:hypothetical protein
VAPILIVGIIAITIILMILRFQQRKPYQGWSLLLLGSGILNLVAFFFLSWVRPGVASEIILRLTGSLVGAETSVTGLSLLTDTIAPVDGVSIAIGLGNDLRIAVVFVLLVAITMLVSGGVGMTGSGLSRNLGLIQVGVSFVAAGVLVLSLNRFARLDLDPTLSRPVTAFVKADVGMGVWTTFVGILGSIVGGWFLRNTHFPTPGKRGKYGRSTRRATKPGRTGGTRSTPGRRR